jgi:hypothetical protein
LSDIQELFQKDPLLLTREDLKEIAMYYRDKRNQFNLGDTQAGSAKRIKKEAGPKISNINEILDGIV